MDTAAQPAPLGRTEITWLIEQMRWQLDPILFNGTMARSLSRLAVVNPAVFRAFADLLGRETPSPWAPIVRKLIGDPENETRTDWEFGLTMAAAVAGYEVFDRLEPTKPSAAQLTLSVHHLPKTSDLQGCRAGALCRWLSQQSRKAGDPVHRMGTDEDRAFVAVHVDALMDRAEAFRNRAGIDRELLQRVLDLDTAVLADGAL